MTEVWKVVNHHRGTLTSAVIRNTAWRKVYPPGKQVDFGKELGLAFDSRISAQVFFEYYRQYGGNMYTPEIWRAEAEVAGTVKTILSMWRIEDNTNDGAKEVLDFWRTEKWKIRGTCSPAPPGTVACQSITLLEKCDD